MIHDPQNILFAWGIDESESESHDVDMNELIAWVKANKGTNANLDQSQFYNFNVWRDKAFKVKANGELIYVYAEVFDDGLVNLSETNVDFNITNLFHSGFHVTFKYKDSDDEAVKLWTYSYEYFKNLYAELGFALTEEEENTIIANYKQALNDNKGECNKIDVFLETITDFVLDEISYQDRIDYLKVLSKCSLFDGELYWGNMDTNEEEAVLNILRSFKEGDYDEIDALLAALKAKAYQDDTEILVAKLYSGMDDARGDQFTQFIQELSRLATSSPTYVQSFKNKEDSPEFEKVVYIGKRTWVDLTIVGGERKYDSFKFDKSTGTISYIQEVRKITGSLPLVFTSSPYSYSTTTIYFPTWEWIPDPEVTYSDPFELILVDDLTKFDRAMEKLLEVNNFKTTGGYLIPAISLQYTRTKHSNENIEQGIYIALDVAAVASGVGALSVGAKSLSLARKGYLAFDVINGMANIAVNSTDLYLNEDVQEFVNYYNLITAGLNIKQLYDEGTALMRSADDLANSTAKLFNSSELIELCYKKPENCSGKEFYDLFVRNNINDIKVPDNIQTIWSLGPAIRGRLLESILAVTKYEPAGFKTVAGWNYKYIDFDGTEVVEEILELQGSVVSLKTFNTVKSGEDAINAFEQTLKKSAKALNDANLPSNLSSAEKVLDIAVKDGVFDINELDNLWNIAKSEYPNVSKVNIFEM